MISTVTTSTVSTVTTTALAGSVALIGVLVLFVLLFQKEVSTASDQGRLHKLGRALTIGIIPLLIAFALIVLSRVTDILK
jgi:hypothetical protein